MRFALTARERHWLALLILLLVGVRLVTLGAYPVMDSTESRYAEIARHMFETGEWVMPQFDYGVPFWAKPPLSTWLAAVSMTALGVNEFAVRLPSLLLLLVCGVLVYVLATVRGGRDLALWTLATFAGTALVYISAGAVMTDPALALGTTLSMTGFWIALYGPAHWRRRAGYAFFVGLAIGALAKGPVGAVLTFAPVGLWTLWTRQWRLTWTALPWALGLLLTALLVVPWYWAAERASPGFLDYFLLGEHWKRFVEPGWKGDLYGTAHARPRGSIWLMWIASALPWSLLALGWLVRALAVRRADARRLFTDPWLAYLMLWTLTPMLFFSASSNVLATYVLPGLPAFALILGELWRPAAGDSRSLRPEIRTVLIVGALLPFVLVVTIVSQRTRFEHDLSHKALVELYMQQRGNSAAKLIYVGARPVSAEFYTRGKAVRVPDVAALAPYVNDGNADFFVLRESDLAALPPATRARLTPLGEFGRFRLVRDAPQ